MSLFKSLEKLMRTAMIIKKYILLSMSYLFRISQTPPANLAERYPLLRRQGSPGFMSPRCSAIEGRSGPVKASGNGSRQGRIVPAIYKVSGLIRRRWNKLVITSLCPLHGINPSPRSPNLHRYLCFLHATAC